MRSKGSFLFPGEGRNKRGGREGGDGHRVGGIRWVRVCVWEGEVQLTDFKSALWPLTGATEARYQNKEGSSGLDQLTFLRPL